MFFASLKQTFHKKHAPGRERITAAARINAIMRQLKEEHELLGVTVPGCEQPANTAILGVSEKRGIFLLDELNSDDAHRALLQNRKLRITCRLQGMELKFACALVNDSNDGGLAIYEIALPSQITRVQRRDNYRLRLDTGLVVPVSVPNLEGETVKGQVFDLSTSGIGAYLQTRNSPPPGKLLHGVTLSLGRGRPLKTGIEIRFARQNTSNHMLRIGARFVDLETAQERQIARFLAEQQRKRRRHRPA
jgi:c-di-GMP-binding flagellar brake protein YcgR